MRLAICLLFWMWPFAATADDASAPRPPLTAQERLDACAEVEDAEPERAVALADSVLAEVGISVSMRARALGCRGWAHVGQGRSEDSRRDAADLLILVKELAPGSERIGLLRRAGGILHRSGDRIGAVDLYGRALAEAEAAGLEAERIPLLINLGVHHSEFEQNERARVAYEQALALMEVVGDHRYEAPVRFNLGLTLNGQDKFAEAVPHLERALELLRGGQMGPPGQELTVQLALAIALRKIGERDRANALIDEVRKSDVVESSHSLKTQVLTYEAARLAEQGEFEQAIAVLTSIEQEGLGEVVVHSILEQLAETQQDAGQHAAAAATLKRYSELREAFLRSQNHERVAALEAHLRDREQRVELERLQQVGLLQTAEIERTRRTNLLTALGTGILLMIGIFVFVWQRRMNRRLDLASRTDSLTGLANRRDMTEKLRAIGQRGPGSGVRHALFVIDIDHFKLINDRHGHDAGDQMLCALATRLRSAVRSEDALARWGGEEFLLLAQLGDAGAAEDLAERLRQRMTPPFAYRGQNLQASVSIGYAPMPLPGAHGADTWQSSIILADAALYVAKAAGRDGWAGYWMEHPAPDWPAERIAHELKLARARGIVRLRGSRQIPETLHAIA